MYRQNGVKGFIYVEGWQLKLAGGVKDAGMLIPASY